jgi:hypothetical protein
MGRIYIYNIFDSRTLPYPLLSFLGLLNSNDSVLGRMSYRVRYLKGYLRGWVNWKNWIYMIIDLDR